MNPQSLDWSKSNSWIIWSTARPLLLLPIDGDRGSTPRNDLHGARTPDLDELGPTTRLYPPAPHDDAAGVARTMTG
jgi:hypothetical protein